MTLVDDTSSKIAPRSEEVSNARKSTRTKSHDTVTSSQSPNHSETSCSLDVEHSVSIYLKRLRVLSKRINPAKLFGEQSLIDSLFASIAKMAHERLEARQVGHENGPSDVGSPETKSPPLVPAIWGTGDQRVHAVVAKSVSEALRLLLSIIAWQTNAVVESVGSIFEADETEEITNDIPALEDGTEHVIVGMRGELCKLLLLCWEQIPDIEYDEHNFSRDLLEFSNSVQQCACQIGSDLRSLFPKEWADSPSPVLQTIALTDDGLLIGGMARYLRWREEEVSNVGIE